jgi:transcription initiation factor TFIIE subunit alpha
VNLMVKKAKKKKLPMRIKTKPMAKVKITEADKSKIQLLKDLVSAVAGPNAINLVDILYGRDNVNEFDIAKNLKITINQVRNILYKLGDEGLVSFTRKKDKKNGGWYTYFWTMNIGKSLENMKGKIENEIKNLQFRLNSKQTKRFYFCVNCDIEMSEENALVYDFTCPECGEVFQLKDNVKIIEHLKNDIVNMKATLVKLDEELEIIYKKEEAVKERRLKAEEKKKKVERDARRIERAKLKKKEMKGKKPVVKKKVKKKTKSKKSKAKPKKKINKKKVVKPRKKAKVVKKKTKGKVKKRRKR